MEKVVKYDKALIVGSARDAVLTCMDKSTLLICADGGLDSVLSAGYVPNMVIGDMDSAKCEVPESIELMLLPKKKDYSDLHVAIDYVLKAEIKNITLTGCTNGRADHYLANIFLLEYISSCGCYGEIIDKSNKIFMHNGKRHDFSCAGYKYISLLPIDEVCKGVTLYGLRFPLENATVKRFCPIGISNEPYDDNVAIEIQSGKAVIILSRETDEQ